MKLSLRVLLAYCLSSAWLCCNAQLCISELMQGNVDCLMDDLNDFPDSWVELYNPDSSADNLSNYSIGITPDANEAWFLPNKTLGSNQYVVVYCDKVGKDMHTPFRLESGKGCSVYLFRNGVVVDKVEDLKKQPAPNVSYGRLSGNSEQWGYQQEPTPALANCGKLCTKVLDDVVFSHGGCVMRTGEQLTVSLSAPEGTPAGAVIRFTMDGSEPTSTSPVYSNPFIVSQNRTIRAKLFLEGWLTGRSVTHSYLFLPREVTLPVVSMVTNGRYLTDSKIGIYVDGNYQSGKKNYEFDWRRPVNIELFEGADVASSVNQLCETRIQGGASRGCVLKSMTVYAHKRFGKKRLAYEFFPEDRPGQDDYKSIILRNAGNDFDYLYMRDAIIQRTMARHVDLDWQAWRPAIFFLNGTYKGMLNIRERSTADNVYTNYDGLEDIDMVENWWDLKEGDMQSFYDFQNFYAEHGHTLDEYAERMDWKEFINLMLTNLYYNNQDFPGNNFVMWRPRAEGGRWRFIVKDTDFGLGLYGSSANYNSIEWIYNPDYDGNRNWANKYEHTRLFRRLMEIDEFKREFIDRAAIYMGDFMNEKGTRKVWDPMYEQIKFEYPNHRKLINQWWPNYESELNSARQWIASRTNIFYSHLASYYKLGTPTALVVNNMSSDEELRGADILFNGVRLSEGQFDGRFFANRRVTLEAPGQTESGRCVTGWKVTIVNNDGTTSSKEVTGNVYDFMMPACRKVVVNAVFGAPNGIKSMDMAEWRWSVVDNQLLLTQVETGTMVSLFDLQGNRLWQGRSNGTDITIPLGREPLAILRIGGKAVRIAR